MKRALAAVAVAVAVALAAAAAPGPAAAAGAPPTAPVLVAASPATTNPAVTYPVEELNGPVESLVFGEATADGAVTDLGGRQFRLASDVLFAFNRSDLTPRAHAEIADVVATLRAGRVTSLSVTGYTDNQGSDAYNRALSQARAEAVRAALAAALGPAVHIAVAGRGEQQPIATNATPAGQALNRRVEIRVA